MVTIIPYCADKKEEWNTFLRTAKNAHFMFHRDYMEYHSNIFKDMSLMIYDDATLIGLVPGNIADQVFYTHQGLTFGGVISNEKMKVPKMLSIFKHIFHFLRKQGIQKVIYKAIPYIYHRYPAQEDLYALHYFQSKLYRVDVSSTIDLRHPLKISDRRKRGIKKALKNGIEIKETRDFRTYIEILNIILEKKYKTSATHTADELIFLNEKFPDHIRLFCAYDQEKMLAGVVIYETDTVAHAQYIAASDEGKLCGALDAVFDYLIHKVYSHKQYFDFGVSTENQGKYLNEGLIQQKEEFGSRAIVHQFWEVNL